MSTMTANETSAMQATVDNLLAEQTLSKRAVCLRISFRKFANSREVKKDQIEIEPASGQDKAGTLNKDLLSIRKKLLNSPKLKAINNYDAGCERWLKLRCVDSPTKKGCWMVPVVEVPALIERIKTVWIPERRELVEDMLVTYPDEIAEISGQLDFCFDLDNYPTVDRMRQYYRIDWNFEKSVVPGELEEIGEEYFAEAQRKAAAEAQREVDAIRDGLYGGLQYVVEWMIDKLTGAQKNGNPKAIHTTSFNNMMEFFACFKGKNILGDNRLDQLADKATAALNGFGLEDLKNDYDARVWVRSRFQDINDAIKLEFVNKPKRTITFEDDEA